MQPSLENVIARIPELPCWSGPVTATPLGGGISNHGFLVEDGARKYVVRFGDDVPVHLVVRTSELAASRAAHAAGIAPAVIHDEPGVLVLEYIAGKTLEGEDVASDAMLARVLALVRRCHRDLPRHLVGPPPMFWPFHSLRHYERILRAGESPHLARLPDLMAAAAGLEAAVGAIDLVFAHNDLLAANLIDDGQRLWLIDYEYAGFSSPLFDLGNLASNNGLVPRQENWLLETYFERTVDDELRRRYGAMKVTSLLREAMWSMVSELHSGLDFDYRAYSEDHLARFEAAYGDFENS